MRFLGLLLLVSVLVLAPRARADSALELIEPRIERQAYLQLLEALHLDDENRLIADLLYSDYAVALEDLGEQITSGAAEAGQQRVDDALGGRIFVDPGELRALRVAVLRAREVAWTSADVLFAELLENVASLVTDDRVDFATVARDLRRSVYLQPHYARRHDERYAGEGIDVIRLVDEARGSGGELERLDPGSIALALDAYARALDVQLVAASTSDRHGRQQLAIARIERDVETQQREQREALERWKAVHEINATAVAEVAGVAHAELGADAARQWRERFDRACFPRLFRPSRPERQHDWILRYVPDATIQVRTREILAEFLVQRAALCRDAIDIMRRGRLELLVPIHPRMDATRLENDRARGLYQELLKNSGRLSSLEAETCGEFEGLLSKRQRKQMASDIAAAAYGRRR